MNTKNILNAVEKLHANAKSGTLIVNEIKYTLTFDGRLYQIKDDQGKWLTTFNTRSLKTARQWLREYLNN